VVRSGDQLSAQDVEDFVKGRVATRKQLKGGVAKVCERNTKIRKWENITKAFKKMKIIMYYFLAIANINVNLCLNISVCESEIKARIKVSIKTLKNGNHLSLTS